MSTSKGRIRDVSRTWVWSATTLLLALSVGWSLVTHAAEAADESAAGGKDVAAAKAGKAEAKEDAWEDEEDDWLDEEEGEDEEGRSQPVFGYVKFGSGYAQIHGDQGKFREDYRVSDQLTGGIEDLLFDSRKDDRRYQVRLRAMYDRDFRFTGKVSKDKLGYLEIFGENRRQWYDATSGYFDAPTYGLSFNDLDSSDSSLHTDRRKFGVELGLTVPDQPAVSLGYERAERKGREVPLWGAAAGFTLSPFLAPPRQRKVPVIREVDGASDSAFLSIEHKFGNVRVAVKQELEQYRDDTFIDEPQYRDLALTERTVWDGEPEYHLAVTTLQIDSHVTDDLYLSGGYMFEHTRNETEFELYYLTPAGARRDASTSGDTGILAPDHTSERDRHVLNFGGVFDITDDWRVTGRVRYENTDTDSESDSGEPTPGTTFPIIEGQQRNKTTSKDRSFSETLSLSFAGLPNAVLSLDADWEQRELGWSEEYRFVPDATQDRDHRADIEYDTATYTGRVTYIPAAGLRLTARYRKTFRERDYDREARDGPSVTIGGDTYLGYPGYLGDFGREQDEVALWATWRLHRALSVTPKYELIDTDFNVEKESPDQVAESRSRRYSLSATVTPCANLYWTTLWMYDDFQIETEASEAGAARAPDFDGDLYTLATNVRAALNEQIVLTLGYQHVDSHGTYRTRRDEVSTGVEYQVAPQTTASLKYTHYRFDDRLLGDLDDYSGNAVWLSVEAKF